MVTLFWAIVVLALAGAVVSWIVGAVFYVRTLSAIDDRATRLQAVFGWLFALKRLRGHAAVHAATVNKAVVAFLACLMVAAAAFSVAINLARVSR